MRICIFGAGAIGGVIAAALHASGQETCLVARGEHLEAIRSHGLRFERKAGDLLTAQVPASSRAADFGPQDVVIVTVKAHALASAAPAILPLLHSTTCVVYTLNGIPWWYFHRSGDPFEGWRIDRLDPSGLLWDEVGIERAIGCVVNFSASVPKPGMVRREGAANRLWIGEPGGTASDRLASVAAALSAAGFEVETETPIREAVWAKLCRGAVSSALATLVAAPSGFVLGEGGLRPLFRDAMMEMRAIAAAYGHAQAESVDPILDQWSGSKHRPSMLQDLEAGRPMEIDAQMTVPQEMARFAGVRTPVLDMLFALARARARAAGLYDRTQPVD